MSDICEVIFTSDASEDKQLSLAAWDLRTGTNLMNYKGGGCVQAQSLCILGAQYVIGANSTKPLLHVWPINGQEQISSVRFVVPGRVNALALSPCSCYIVAGIQESIYIWHLNTGRMLNTLSKHYQAISCIKFTDDGHHFVSAGKDGNVLVWNLTQVVSQGDNNQVPTYSFNDHGLPVTDLHIGIGGVYAYLYTVSLDRSCKVYDLCTGNLLLSVVFTESLHSIVVDPLETSVYVGTGEGKILQFRVDSVPRIKEYHMESSKSVEFIGHKAGMPVTCLALSLDGKTLVSGGQDQQVCLWHIGSQQLIKTMPHKGSLNNIRLRLSNPTIFHPEHKQPQIFAEQLRRMIDPPEADEEQAIEVLVTERQPAYLINPYEYLRQAGGSNNNVNASATSPKGHTAAAADDSADQSEVQRLSAEVARLKRINKELFLTCAGSKLKAGAQKSKKHKLAD